MKVILGVFLALILPLLSYNGCKQSKDTYLPEMTGELHHKQMQSEHSWVGAASVDITPPPGRSTSGYATGADRVKGFRSRLKARSFYIEPQSGPPLLLIQADLLSGSSLLHRELGKRLRKQSKVQTGAILIAGTHTHGGPGNYFASNFYNDWAGIDSGLDKGYFNFLLDQLERASLDAIKNKKRGYVSIKQMDIKGLTRNRSLEAYLANGSAPNFSTQNSVNPSLTMLRLDAFDHGKLKPIGIFANYSIHGTAIGPGDLYNADLFHYPSAVMESYLRQNYKLPWPVTVGVANGSHGDNSPKWKTQGFNEAKRLGELLGQGLIEAFNKSKINTTPLKTAVVTEEFDLMKAAHSGGSKLCSPKVGMALLGGAEDYRSPLSILPGFSEGWPQKSKHCQGAKRIFGSFLQETIVEDSDFPRFATVQTIKINDLSLLAMPFEVTKTMAQKLLSSLRNKDTEKATVISCSNGYLGYLTTSEEYSLQHYEGGHSLFGPYAGEFFSQKVGKMKDKMKQGKLYSRWQEWEHELRIGNTQSIAKERPGFQISPQIVDRGEDDGNPYIFMTWVHEAPHKMAFHKPLISVQAKAKNNRWFTWISDESSQLEIRLLKDSGNKGFYEVRLHPPFNSPSTQIRFLIHGAPGSKPEASPPVTIR